MRVSFCKSRGFLIENSHAKDCNVKKMRNCNSLFDYKRGVIMLGGKHSLQLKSNAFFFQFCILPFVKSIEAGGTVRDVGLLLLAQL